jgi:8-oxo-dGTP diphosphatase
MSNTHGVAGRAVIRRPDGRILLILRHSGCGVDPGKWELPGGKLEPGETLRTALAREVVEETHLDINPGHLLGIAHQSVGPVWVTSVAFDCGIVDRPVAVGEEHSDHMWVEDSDLKRLELTGETLDHLAAIGLRVAGGDPAEGS